MPVYKYKTFEEANRSQWVFDIDATYFDKVRELFKIANRLNSIKYPKGIFLYKTFEEANLQRYQWEIEHALRKQKEMI